MLHANYLCFLWHPALAPVRDFVKQHPVHPDDVTVSTIVSQLAGQAPRVYSRRLNPPDKNNNENNNNNLRRGSQKRRNLSELDLKNMTLTQETTTVREFDKNQHDLFLPEFRQDWILPPSMMESSESESIIRIPSSSVSLKHRRLMFGINWDARGGAMNKNKQIWADLRTEAINSLVQYFGSINSGSIGWCDKDSKEYNHKKDGRCDPSMARIGQLSWMKPNTGEPKETCP